MFREETVLIDCPEDISLTDDISFLDSSWLELPQFFGIEGWNINSLRNED